LRQSNIFLNRLIFDEVKAYKNGAIFSGQPVRMANRRNGGKIWRASVGLVSDQLTLTLLLTWVTTANLFSVHSSNLDSAIIMAICMMSQNTYQQLINLVWTTETKYRYCHPVI